MSPLLAVHRHGPQEPLPLVLLHAFPFDSSMWEDVLAKLTDVPVITLDAPGFGKSPGFRDLAETLGKPLRPSLEVYTDAVAATLREEGVERAVVAGISMGGYVTLCLAARHPDLLAGVGLLDTKAEADDDYVRQNRIKMAEAATEQGSSAAAPLLDTVLGETTRSSRPDVVERVRSSLAAAPPAGITWAQMAMASRPNRLAALEDLHVPALVLRGAEDEMSSQAAAETMAGALDDSELVVVPRSGHLTAVEAPEEVADALRQLHERCR